MEERYNIRFIVLILQKQEFREFMECLDMRKLNENEKKLITLLLSKSNLTFNMPNDLSNMDVVDLDDGGMGSIAKSTTTWTPILVLVGHSNKLLGKLECCLTWTVSS